MKYLKKKRILYCNSMTRLFIGETDEESIKQRYLSNIIVKNDQRLNLNGSYIDLSAGYLKQLYHKIKKQKNENVSNEKQKTKNNNKSQIALKKPLKGDFIRILEIEEKFRKKKEKPKYFFPSIMNLVKIGKKQKKYNNTSSTQSSIKKTLESNSNKNKHIIDTEKIIKQKNNIKKIKKKLKINIDNSSNSFIKPKINKNNNSKLYFGNNSNITNIKDSIKNTHSKENKNRKITINCINKGKNDLYTRLEKNRFLIKKKMRYNSADNILCKNYKKKPLKKLFELKK